MWGAGTREENDPRLAGPEIKEGSEEVDVTEDEEAKADADREGEAAAADPARSRALLMWSSRTALSCAPAAYTDVAARRTSAGRISSPTAFPSPSNHPAHCVAALRHAVRTSGD